MRVPLLETKSFSIPSFDSKSSSGVHENFKCLRSLLVASLLIIAAASLTESSMKKVVQICASSNNQIEKLLRFTDQFEVDLWSVPRAANDCVLAAVENNRRGECFYSSLTKEAIAVQVMHETLHKYLNSNQLVESQSRVDKIESPSLFKKYHDYSSYRKILVDWRSKYPGRLALSIIGKSMEGRDILAISMNDVGPWKGQGRPRSMVMDCGIHAREWISPAICMYVINQLIENPRYRYLLQKYRMHIIPILNPDGYAYTWSKDRLWRKNRAKTGACYGVDLNRNFDIDFCNVGSSKNPCSETFCGPKAFSEPETESFKSFTEKVNRSVPIAAYFSIHSYGQWFTHPWGYTTKKLPDARARSLLAMKAAGKMKRIRGTGYVTGQTAQKIYASSGGSDDWMQAYYGLGEVFLLESQDKGTYGFVLPSKYILAAAQEAMVAVETVLVELAKE